MDLSTHTVSVRMGAVKTAASRAEAEKSFVRATDPLVRPISTDVSDFRDRGHRVIFGNCLHAVPGGYAMWSAADNKTACGESYIWYIPENCAVAAVRVGVCPGNSPAWAVEIRA